MAKKLSIIEGQTSPQVGWNEYNGNPYNEDTISKIKDNVGDLEIPVSSIPSPFAQMHLFETAFGAINELHNIEGKRALTGNSTYHKLISNCLDVYELLYSYDLLQIKGRLDVRTWKVSEIEEMLDSSSEGMVVFAETLLLFIRNYNQETRFTSQGVNEAFKQLTLIYLDDEIVAGASPYTGFFVASEKLPSSIKTLNNRTFFKESAALYERSEEFQSFLNAFFTAHPLLVSSFGAVYTYIKNNQKYTSKSLAQSLSKMGFEDNMANILSDYTQLDILNNPIYIFDKVPFYYKRVAAVEIETEVRNSDYAIRTSKNIEETPLVLSSGLNNKHWTYIRSELPEDLPIPDYPTEPIAERKLPDSEIEFPYVVRNDFLTRHLIKLPYEVNTEKFWLPEEYGPQDILLPIKKEYFDYFTIDDLRQHLKIELMNSGAISVELTIPVKGSNEKGSITFERTYLKQNPKNLEDERKGTIQESSLGMGIYPFFRVNDIKYNDRTKVMLVHTPKEQFDCHFLRENVDKPQSELIPSEFIVRTRANETDIYESRYIEISNISVDDNDGVNLESNVDLRYDLLELNGMIKDVDFKAMLVPLFKDQYNLVNTNATLGFDIGTSNSFVSVLTGGRKAERLSTYKDFNGHKGLHMTMLQKPESDVRKSTQFDFNEKVNYAYVPAQFNEFLPSMIGDESDYQLPFRTIINLDNDATPNELGSLSILSNINIPFGFGRVVPRRDLDGIYSNLKWGITDPSNREARNRLFCFIEQLAWMARNKLLSEGINPEFAEVVWFKPLSMSDQQRTIFNSIWEQVFNMYFSKSTGRTDKLLSVTESWAPFYSYNQAIPKGRVFLNLDIGGGTTDLLVFEDNAPLITTSFRFAGDSLFDDGLSTGNDRDNGFVQKYSRIMEDEVLSDDHTRKVIQEYIYGSKDLRSSDLVGFYFTIKEFRDRLVLDGDFQLLFLLHSSAIFYHICEVLKVKDIAELPSLIGFSGNGSKLLSITNRGSNLNRSGGVMQLFRNIMGHFFTDKDIPKMEAISLENPKEATAFGGVLGLERIKRNPTADLDTYYISIGDNEEMILKNDASVRKVYQYRKFLKTEDNTIKRVTDNVAAFFDLFLDDLWYECLFVEQFGLEKSYNPEKLKEFFCDKKRIQDAIRDAINRKVTIEEEPVLTETLFFYPIKSMLYAFSKIIAANGAAEYKGHE